MARMVEEEERDAANTQLRPPQHMSSTPSDEDIGDPDAPVVVYPFEERYELRKTLGEGGMGEVRLCRDRMIGREVAMMALAYSLSWVIFFPLQVAMGIRSWALALLPLTLWMLTSLLAWVAYRLDHTGPRVFPYVTLSGALALAATTVLHGPFFVVPAIGAVLAMGMALVKYKSHRVFSTAVFALAVGAPALLAWAGLHPVTRRFVDGAFILMPGAIQLPRDGTFVFLTMVNMLVLLFTAKFAGEYRDQLTSLELENHLQAWQLRQLVPAEAARALDPGLPGGK